MTYLLVSKMVDRLNALLLAHGRPAVEVEAMQFAWDSTVDDQTDPPTIAPANLFGAESFEMLLASEFAHGPSWAHLNMTSTDGGAMVGVIHLGARIGNPNPSINVSFDKKVLHVRI